VRSRRHSDAQSIPGLKSDRRLTTLPDTILRRDAIPQRADLLGWRLSRAVVIGIEGREFG
jgi:hypothetical protein